MSRALALRRATPMVAASALAVGAFGISACAVEHYPISASPVYMSGHDRIVVRGGSLARQRELQRYVCAGEMVLVCDIQGGVAECTCAGTRFPGSASFL